MGNIQEFLLGQCPPMIDLESLSKLSTKAITNRVAPPRQKHLKQNNKNNRNPNKELTTFFTFNIKIIKHYLLIVQKSPDIIQETNSHYEFGKKIGKEIEKKQNKNCQHESNLKIYEISVRFFFCF